MSWLTAVEALQVLQVRPQTLYANVSRRKIRAKPDPKDSRRSLYHEADVRKMARQHGGQRKAAAVAAAAIQWGDPLLPSAVSTVVEGKLYYRGRDAVVLAETASLEEVARALWGMEGVEGDRREGAIAGASAIARGEQVGRAVGPIRAPALGDALGARFSNTASPLQRAFLSLGLRAATDLASFGRALPVLQTDAAALLMALADALLGEQPRPPAHGRRAGRAQRSPSPVPALLHERVASGWRRRGAADIIRRALVLLVDHELNASTFATRVAVSTGAPLAAGVLSGLCALSGPLHGRASMGVSRLVASVEKVGAEATVREWLSMGHPVAGFGHPLYPWGDPRAKALMRQFTLPEEYAELSATVEREIGEQPNIDFALSALTRVYGLPREAPLILFALGRCVGWLAHALEQVTTGQPIRPRAQYVGPPISV
jgi:citrate synthase